MKKRYQLLSWNEGNRDLPDIAVTVTVDMNHGANSWMACDSDGQRMLYIGKPADSQIQVALVALAHRLGAEIRDPVDREKEFDVELATAMLLDIKHAEPGSPIRSNPMTFMIARLARGVLRAHGKKDPTDGGLL